jgi:hypothetical protein
MITRTLSVFIVSLGVSLFAPNSQPKGQGHLTTAAQTAKRASKNAHVLKRKSRFNARKPSPAMNLQVRLVVVDNSLGRSCQSHHLT